MVAFITFSLLASCAPPALCAEKSDDAIKPERLLIMAAEYPGVITLQGKEVSMDLNFINKGRTDETVEVKVAQKPEGWKTKIKTYRYSVTGVHVPADDKNSLTFEAVPDKDVPPGEYIFVVEAQTRDGRYKMNQKISVTLVGDQPDHEKNHGVKLTTAYPVIRGPSDAAFEFSVEVDSRVDKEAIFDLFAQGPKGWDINFKPAYETKYISSIRLKANQSQVAVSLRPRTSSPRSFLGNEAFGIPALTGDDPLSPKIVITDTPDKSDPLNQLVTVGVKLYFAALRLAAGNTGSTGNPTWYLVHRTKTSTTL